MPVKRNISGSFLITINKETVYISSKMD